MFESPLDTEHVFGKHEPMHRTYVRRRRIVGTLIGVSLAIAALGPLAHAVGEPTFEPVVRRTYVVQAGDTLWSIAGSVAPGQDPRPLVQVIMEANRVDPGALMPGQTLVVPS